MASLSELISENSKMSSSEIEHVTELIAEWRLLADLSFEIFYFGYQYVEMRNLGLKDI
jgi:hypothetical protein